MVGCDVGEGAAVNGSGIAAVDGDAAQDIPGRGGNFESLGGAIGYDNCPAGGDCPARSGAGGDGVDDGIADPHGHHIQREGAAGDIGGQQDAEIGVCKFVGNPAAGFAPGIEGGPYGAGLVCVGVIAAGKIAGVFKRGPGCTVIPGELHFDAAAGCIAGMPSTNSHFDAGDDCPGREGIGGNVEIQVLLLTIVGGDGSVGVVIQPTVVGVGESAPIGGAGSIRSLVAEVSGKCWLDGCCGQQECGD